MYDLKILNGCVYQDGEFIDSNIYIKDEKIALLSQDDLPAKESFSAAGLLIAPGMIDAHVHISLSGTGGELSSDDYKSGSVTAAHGGITTMIDFLGEAATVSEMQEFYEQKQKTAQASLIDFAWHASARDLEDSADAMANQAVKQGTPTIKLYTTYKPGGIYSSPESIAAFIKRSAQGDVRIIIHAEDDELIDHENDDAHDLADNRPPACEIEEVKKIAEWTRKYDGNAYIVHVNCGSTVKMLKEDYADILGKNLYLEGCPQYFLFDKSVYDGDDFYRYTITPPFRSLEEQKLLRDNWQELSVFATDHCPFSLAGKRKAEGKLSQMPMGMGGMEFLFPIMYTLFDKEAIKRLTVNPAKLFGIYPQKGIIAPGSDADLVFFKEEKNILDSWHSAADDSAYFGFEAKAKVVSTMCRGHWIVKNGETVGENEGRFVFGSLN